MSVKSGQLCWCQKGQGVQGPAVRAQWENHASPRLVCSVYTELHQGSKTNNGPGMMWLLQDILDRTKVAPGKVSAFVELHIEQGPLLEREGLQIGVVTAIAAPASFRVQFNGDGGHAGALLMHDRSADPC